MTKEEFSPSTDEEQKCCKVLDREKKSDVRLAVIGAPGVGKSAISVRFMTRRYIGEYQPCTEHNYTRSLTFGNDLITYELKDTASTGDEKHHIAWANCIVIVYAIDNRTSFTAAEKTLQEIEAYQGERGGSAHELTYAVIANKNELEHLRCVTTEEGKTLARKYKADFWEMSAADDYESTYGPLRSMVVESYFNATKTPINPVRPSSLDEIQVTNTQNEKNRRSSHELLSSTAHASHHTNRRKSEKKKSSLGNLFMENFTVPSEARNDVFRDDDKPHHPWSRRERQRSSLKRDKPLSVHSKKVVKSHSLSDIKYNNHQNNRTKSTGTPPSSPPTSATQPRSDVKRSFSIKEKKHNNNTGKENATIINLIMPPPIAPLGPNSKSSLINDINNNNNPMSTENALENFNAIMLAPGYDLSRILSRGRPEKRSTRSKFSSMFKQRGLEAEG